MIHRLLSDFVALTHLGFVAFVVLGGLLALRWRRAAWFHLPALFWGITIVFTGWICPLTPLENRLRARGGTPAYGAGFVEHYLLPILYPGPMTDGVRLAIGAGVIGVNIIIYGWVVARRRARRSLLGGSR